MKRIAHSWICLGLTLTLAACGPGAVMTTPDDAASTTCGTDTRGELYAPGMTQTGKDHLLTVKLLTSTPGPPIKGNNNWVITVTDTTGAPVDGLAIKVIPFMPDHGHGTPILVGVTPMGNGTYDLNPVNLFMAGLWQVSINMTTTDMHVDQSVFSFCIEG